MVAQEAKAVKLKNCCMGASTPLMVYFTEVMGEDMVEMIDLKFGNGIEVKNTREKVWTMKDEQGDPKKVREQICWGYNKLGMSPASLAGKVWAHAASFV